MSVLLPKKLSDMAPDLCRGSNLAFALFFLPAAQRHPMRIFYTFCRIVDDIADSPAFSLAEKQERLDSWKSAFSSPGLHALPSDLRELILEHGVDTRYFLELIRGVESDLHTLRYQTFEELKTYCWRVASAVGLVSIRIFGCTHPDTERYAEAAGMALQMTNILRDIDEDLARGRIYLPLEDLARFGVSEGDFSRKEPGAGFLPLMEFEATRARNYFQEARDHLPASEKKRLRVSEMMQNYYRHLLDKMAQDHFRGFERRYRLSLAEKMGITLRTMCVS